MNRRVLLFGATTALVVGVVAPALARPGYLAAFKANYNTAQGKPALNAANCALCHIGMPNQARWNVYGEALRTNLAGAKMVPAPRITEAMKAVEGRQNPATGQSFLAMINGDRFPDLVLSGDEITIGIAETSGPPIVPGDASGDGELTAGDVDQLVSEIFDGDGEDALSCGAPPIFSAAGADGNADGLIGASDLTAATRIPSPLQR